MTKSEKLNVKASIIEQQARSMVEGPEKTRLICEAEKLRMQALNMDEASGEGLVAITAITLGIVLVVLFWIMCNAYLGGL